jgi:uncharacterized protein YjbI with pentapeptide repeats
MELTNHENKTFDKVNFSQNELKNRSFEKCIFTNCDFSNSSLAHNIFIDCKFIGCNMAMTKLHRAQVKDVSFKDCKLIGVNFNESNDFLFCVSFENCIMDYVSFFGKKIIKTLFSCCSLKESNFSNADLTSSIFKECNLERAIFNDTQLKNTDFTTAYNFSIDPEVNFIKKAKFSKNSLEGLLTKYDITIE